MKFEISYRDTPYDMKFARVVTVDVFYRAKNGSLARVKFVNDPPMFQYEGKTDYKRRFLTSHATLPMDEAPLRKVYIDTEQTLEDGSWITNCASLWSNTTKEYETYVLGLADDSKIVELCKTYQNVKIYSSEAELVSAVVSRLIDLDFDLLLGWNVDWDVSRLHEACVRNKLNFSGLSPAGLVRESHYGPLHKPRIAIYGREVFDLCQGTKAVIEKLSGGEHEKDYTLRTIAKNYVNITKPDYRGSIKDLLINNPVELVRYNRDVDTQAIVLIDQKLRITETFEECQREFQCELQDGFAISTVILLNLVRLAKQMGITPPDKSTKPAKMKLQGPLNIEPSTGVISNAVTFDYSSLYPNIVLAFNMSPETIDPSGDLKVGNGTCFSSKKEGLVPAFVRKCIAKKGENQKLRDSFPKDSDQRFVYHTRRNFYKLAANATIGVLADPEFIWYTPLIADSVYFIAREVLGTVKSSIESSGSKMHYGHTDSCTVEVGGNGDLMTRAKSMQEKLNKITSDYATAKGINPQGFKMAIDKVYKRLLLTGGHNRYAGFTLDGEFIIGGFLRGVTSDNGRDFLTRLIKEILDMKHLPDPKAWCNAQIKAEIESIKSKNPMVLGNYHTLRKSEADYAKRTNTFLAGLKESNERFNYGLEVGETCIYLPVSGFSSKQLAFPLSAPDVPQEVKDALDWDKIIENNVFARIEEIDTVLDVQVKELRKLMEPTIAKVVGRPEKGRKKRKSPELSPLNMTLSDFLR